MDSYLVSAGPSGHMQYSPVLSAVDVLATEHRIDLLPELGRLGKVDQELWMGSMQLRLFKMQQCTAL